MDVTRRGWKIQKDFVKLFVGKRVKLVQKNNFVLEGVIEAVSEDSLIFRTDQKKSLIHFDVITEIVSEW